MSGSSKRFVGAIDQGTSSTRFALFNEAGDIVDSHQIENKIISSHPGWAEHDPMMLLSITKACMDQVMKNFQKEQVVGIGITNQRESVVVWDKSSGSPLYNAILWLDSRTSSVCSSLAQRFGSRDYFRPICGLPISTYFSATKIIWMIENIPAVAKAFAEGSCYFGTIDSWLIWNLTGGTSGGLHVTDLTNASRTMLFDLHSLSWSEKICSELNIPLSCLPRIISNSEFIGRINAASLLDGVPISGCIGDQHAAMVGQLCLQKGDIKTTYGTGAFMLLNTGSEIIQSKHGLLTTITAKLGPNELVQFALEGSIAYSGALIQWLRDNMNLISDVHEITQLASSVEDNGGVYFVPAFCGLFAPHWRDDARGLIIGLTQYSQKAHLARAALESICFSIKEVVKAMESDSNVTISKLRVDGGMSVSDFIMQLQSEVLHIPTERPSMLETTALGAAIAAGLSVGFWSSLKDFMAKRSSSYQQFKPIQPEHIYEECFNQYTRAVQRSIGWNEDKTDT